MIGHRRLIRIALTLKGWVVEPLAKVTEKRWQRSLPRRAIPVRVLATQRERSIAAVCRGSRSRD
jgi:hypothetical protein